MQLQNRILWSKYNDVSFHHLNSLHKRKKSLPESQQIYAGFPLFFAFSFEGMESPKN